QRLAQRRLGQRLAQRRLGQRPPALPVRQSVGQRLAQLVTAETAVSSSPVIGIVVLQPTAFCNINCSYCYLPDRNNKHVLEQSTVTRLFTELFASGWTAPQLTVIWHAGEPLVVPPAFYREAFATI